MTNEKLIAQTLAGGDSSTNIAVTANSGTNLATKSASGLLLV